MDSPAFIPYTTLNLHLAAYVYISTKVKPALRLVGTKRVEFAFQALTVAEDEDIAKAFLAFSSSRALVEPRAYQEVIASLKRQIEATASLAAKLS